MVSRQEKKRREAITRVVGGGGFVVVSTAGVLGGMQPPQAFLLGVLVAGTAAALSRIARLDERSTDANETCSLVCRTNEHDKCHGHGKKVTCRCTHPSHSGGPPPPKPAGATVPRKAGRRDTRRYYPLEQLYVSYLLVYVPADPKYRCVVDGCGNSFDTHGEPFLGVTKFPAVVQTEDGEPVGEACPFHVELVMTGGRDTPEARRQRTDPVTYCLDCITGRHDVDEHRRDLGLGIIP